MEQDPRFTYNYPLSIAPMMDWTDRHYRYMMRLLTRRTLLYSEMVTTGALLHGDVPRHLDFSELEHPLALQLGGDSPEDLARCALLAEDWGYDEVNLNVGCPSSRVQKGNFGACLMATPQLVADAVVAMQENVSIPITVKHRIGIDHLDRYEDLVNFVSVVNQALPAKFTVHARIAWLEGLSPKENRDVPPLRYDDVYQLKQDFPQVQIELNGGVHTLEEASAHLQKVDAVMIGRAAYHTPYLFAHADTLCFAEVSPVASRHDVVMGMIPYVQAHLARGGRLQHIAKHMLSLFAKMPGTKAWKRHISTHAHKEDADENVLLEALAKVPQESQHDTTPLHAVKIVS